MEITKCPNCGGDYSMSDYLDGDNFLTCLKCGAVYNIKTNNITYSKIEGEKKSIRKCPSCGEILKTYDAICPTCGYELNEKKVSESMLVFHQKIMSEDNNKKKIELIKTYPVPNTKEDIIEFMLLSSSNFDLNEFLTSKNNNVSEAWFTKLELCYKKAKLMFDEGPQLAKITEIYDGVFNQIESWIDKNNKEYRRSILKRRLKIGGVASLIAIPILVVIIAIMYFTFRTIPPKYANVYESDRYNISNGYNNNYDQVYTSSEETVYKLVMADINNFVIAAEDYEDAYNRSTKCYNLNTSYISLDSIDYIISKLNYENIKMLDDDTSRKYTLVSAYEKTNKDIKYQASNYINDHTDLKAADENEYGIVLSCRIKLYVYEVYDAFKDTKDYYYAYEYIKSSFDISLCSSISDIETENIKLNLITVNYNTKSKLQSYTIKFENATEYKITDKGLGKNHSECIDLSLYSTHSLTEIKTYGYTWLKIKLSFSLKLVDKGNQEIRISNNENYDIYLYRVNKEFTTETKQYNDYSLEYYGNIDDINMGKVYIFYDASGSGDDDWMIKDLKVDIIFSMGE